MHKILVNPLLILLILSGIVHPTICNPTKTLDTEGKWFHLYNRLVVKPQKRAAALSDTALTACLSSLCLYAIPAYLKYKRDNAAELSFIACTGGVIASFIVWFGLCRTELLLPGIERKVMDELLESLPLSTLPEEVNAHLEALKNLPANNAHTIEQKDEEIAFLKTKCINLFAPDKRGPAPSLF